MQTNKNNTELSSRSNFFLRTEFRTNLSLLNPRKSNGLWPDKWIQQHYFKGKVYNHLLLVLSVE